MAKTDFRIPPHGRQSLPFTPIASIRGLPTQFDPETGTWRNFSKDIKEYCTIEVLIPNTINFIVGSITVKTLKLDPTFEFEMKTPLSYVVEVSSTKYGFQFLNESNAKAFAKALSVLKSNTIPSFMQHDSQKLPRGVERNNQLPSRKVPVENQQPYMNSPLKNIYQQPPGDPYNNLFPRRPQRPDNPFPYNSSNIKGKLNPFAGNINQPYNMFGMNRPPSRPFTAFTDEKEKKYPSSSAEERLSELAELIEIGDLGRSREILSELVQSRAKVSITSLGKQTGFDIHIKVEDKVSFEAAPITLSVDPFNTTVRALKYQVYQKYGFLVGTQMFIINNRLAKDSETLSQCGIKASGTVIYLYLKFMNDTERMKDKEVQTDVQANLMNNPFARQGPGYGHGSNRAQGYTGRNETIVFPEVVYSQPQSNESNLKGAAMYASPSNYRLPLGNPPATRGMGFKPTPNFGQAQSNKSNLQGAAMFDPYNAYTRPLMNAPASRVSEGWNCQRCTYRNRPTFPECQICSCSRPENYKVPPNYKLLPEEEERIQKTIEKKRLQALDKENAEINYQYMIEAYEKKLLANQEKFECLICYDDVEVGDGVMLRECLHCFCGDCLIETIKASEDPEVRCPYNGDFTCPAVITMQEIEALLPEEDFNKHLEQSLTIAERRTKDSFHCRTPNCIGFCFFEDDVNAFDCEVCGKQNCLTCKAIHTGITCKQYQYNLMIAGETDEAAKKTYKMFQELINRGEAMNCPQCQVILQKKSGCDWMKCTMCHTEICWATKGPRWGPGGNGDTSGGCGCSPERRCAPDCGFCH